MSSSPPSDAEREQIIREGELALYEASDCCPNCHGTGWGDVVMLSTGADIECCRICFGSGAFHPPPSEDP